MVWYKIDLLDPFGDRVIVKIMSGKNFKDRLKEKLKSLYVDKIISKYKTVWKKYSKKYDLAHDETVNELEYKIWNADKPKYTYVFSLAKTCMGCYYDSPGQRSHMDENGGCLYGYGYYDNEGNDENEKTVNRENIENIMKDKNMMEDENSLGDDFYAQ